MPLTAFTKLIIGMLVAAFMGWAGVVWRASEDLGERLTRIEEKLDYYSQQQQQHATQPWHDRAGEAIIKLQTLMLREQGGHNEP